MRLQRFLSLCGVASRRRAEGLILAGRVTVNGEVVRELGTQVDPDRDEVIYQGRVLRVRVEREVWLLHKPRGVITTMRDPQGRTTVADLMRRHSKRRLVPAGRLDAMTTGLAVMTDDGDLALRLTHPRWGVDKEYLVTAEGTPSGQARRALCEGIDLDGRLAKVQSLEPARSAGPPRAGCSRWTVVVHEGRFHLVRRLFEAIGHPVVGLHRTRVGPLRLEQLPRGRARRLTVQEVTALRRVVGFSDGQEKTDPEHNPPQD